MISPLEVSRDRKLNVAAGLRGKGNGELVFHAYSLPRGERKRSRE